MVLCVANGCNNKKHIVGKFGITFHLFPREQERRLKWIEALNKPSWLPTSSSVVCSEHFKPEDIDRTSYSCVVLKKNAVPSIFPQQVIGSYQEETNERLVYTDSMEDSQEENVPFSEHEVLVDSQEYLICLIESFPVLYNPSDPDYESEEKVTETWQIIANIVELSIEDCQNEWEMLLSKYTKQRKVILEHKAKGFKAKSTWPLYDAFNFIDKYLELEDNQQTLNDEYKMLVQDLIEADEMETADSNDVIENGNLVIHSEPSLKKTKTDDEISQISDGSKENHSRLKFTHSQNMNDFKPPAITDINEDVQFVNSILPVLVRMKRRINAQCKSEIMALVSNYESDEEF